MLQRLRNRARGQEGFTLIELLVVILIIGILAAVAIPTFLSQTGKAKEANIQSDLNTLQTAEATYNTNQAGGGYVTSNTNISALTSIEPAITNFASATAIKANSLTFGTATNSYGATDPTGNAAPKANYSITMSAPDGVQYALTDYTDGGVAYTCNVPTGTNAGGCQLPTGKTSGAGTWGAQ